LLSGSPERQHRSLSGWRRREPTDGRGVKTEEPADAKRGELARLRLGVDPAAADPERPRHLAPGPEFPVRVETAAHDGSPPSEATGAGKSRERTSARASCSASV